MHVVLTSPPVHYSIGYLGDTFTG